MANYYDDYYYLQISQMALVVKNPPANARDIRDTGQIPRSGRFSREGNGNPLHHFLPGKFHGQMSLVGQSTCSQLNDSELRLLLLFSRPFTMLGRSPGEGKGHPLKYSGLENSMDFIVHCVAKSWTQLSDFHFTSLHFTSLTMSQAYC